MEERLTPEKGPSMGAKAQDRARGAPQTDRYFELVKRFPLRPLRSEAELDAAIVVIDRLTDCDRLEPGEQDYLDVLGDLPHGRADNHQFGLGHSFG